MTSRVQGDVTGDGWVVAGDGKPRWGIFGAAGLLLRRVEAGSPRFLIAERSAHVHHGGTWGIPGGALRRGESPEEGARREAEEEFGPMPAYTVAEVIVADFGGWAYSTVVADTDAMVALQPVTYEHTAARWATLDEMTHLSRHPGLSSVLSTLERRR